ncbi:hypothetical protein Poli38472_009304 [Pythium oligandrum]|uniref:Uncharacterized protein n=1 Tax=Pythium oligandrum TaxID=41045 RepID=A0A8K1CKH5_PYTOL|nr:hypothetical protein Poli38472_009304 [Pythium oligandrum]|eukprot:TMW65137.1 hypothetical protein Poli38472_009304 [Pythium oligandrum]
MGKMSAAKARLLYVLSPAKTLDMTSPTVAQSSVPKMLAEAQELVTELRKLSPAKMKALLGVSDALAKLNHGRYRDFAFLDEKEAATLTPSAVHKQAVLSFNGPAYVGLAANELSEKDLAYAQSHLRILCGLYGMLRPLDLIQAYRLEMGQKFATAKGKDLYAFWGTRLSQEINALFAEDAGSQKVLVNVASQEYFKSIALDVLDDDVHVIECVFKDDGKIKSVYAKRARGLMCRYLVTKQVDSIDGIKAFDLEGYAFSAKESDDNTFVFNRSVAKQKQALKETQAKAKRAKDVKKEEKDDEEEHTEAPARRTSTRKRRKTES